MRGRIMTTESFCSRSDSWNGTIYPFTLEVHLNLLLEMLRWFCWFNSSLPKTIGSVAMVQMHGGYCNPICWNLSLGYCTHWRCFSSYLVHVAAQCCCLPWRNTGGSGVKNGTPEIDFGKLQLIAQEPGSTYGGPAVRNLPRRTPGTKNKWTNWWKKKGLEWWYEMIGDTSCAFQDFFPSQEWKVGCWIHASSWRKWRADGLPLYSCQLM